MAPNARALITSAPLRMPESNSTGRPPYPIQVAVDVALLARYYERFADQAVSVAKRLDYVVAGTMPDEPPI